MLVCIHSMIHIAQAFTKHAVLWVTLQSVIVWWYEMIAALQSDILINFFNQILML